MKEQDLSFFQPFWRRVVVTAFCIIWSIVEWTTASPFWGIVTTGIAFYCYWSLFLNFVEKPAEGQPPEDPDQPQ